jgi:hypothetical protein
MGREVPYTATFLAVKLIDIGLVTVYFFVLGIVVAKVFDYAYGDFNADNYKDYSNIRLFIEIVLHLFLLGVVAYVMRNIVELIPFPFEKFAGFRHERLKELEGGPVMAIVLILFQKNLQDKIAFFAKNVFGITVEI